MFFKAKMSSDHHCRVYLGRLPYDTREKDVERFLQGCGRIRDINLKNGFGFVVGCHVSRIIVLERFLCEGVLK